MCKATSLGEGNSEFKPVKLCLKFDLVSYPARAEGLVNMINVCVYIYVYMCVYRGVYVCIYMYICIYCGESDSMIEIRGKFDKSNT